MEERIIMYLRWIIDWEPIKAILYLLSVKFIDIAKKVEEMKFESLLHTMVIYSPSVILPT